ncbi:MAG: hypothetical protein ACQEQM_05300 [Thermoplasmatota archaeon]
MVQSKGISMVIASLLILSIAAGISSAQSSHRDFDEAEEDIEALYVSLGRTVSILEFSLNNSLNVNLTISINEEVVSYNHSSEYLGQALNHSKEALDTVGYSETILNDIEGEVSSYEYLENLYIPYMKSAQNITSFSESHIDFISNMENAIHVYEEWILNDRDLDYLRDGIDFLNEASYDLSEMLTSIENVGSYIEMVEDERMENEALLDYVLDIHDMLDDYEEFHNEILFLYRSIPSHVDFVVPSEVHPGEQITIYGYYIESGVYMEGIDVSLSVEDSVVNSTITDEDGFYHFDHKLPWDTELGTLNLSVSTKGFNRSAEVDVVKYTSEIRLSVDREEYYEQNIQVQGEFKTQARVPFDDISLDAALNRSVDLNLDGAFTLDYSPELFPWGTSSIEISYMGNDTIQESHASVHFTVNIPTDLTIESQVSGDVGETQGLSIDGQLRNLSSEEPLSGMNIDILVNGRTFTSTQTDEGGVYEEVLIVDDMAPHDGLYRLRSVFHGTDKYRSSQSDIVFIYREGDHIGIGGDPDEARDDLDENGDDEIGFIPWITPGNEIGFIVMVSAVLLFIIYYFIFYKQKDIEEQVEGDIKDKGTSHPVLRIQDVKDLSASSRDDIPKIYHIFINRLKDKGDFTFKKGTTHRDIEKEISHKTGMDEINTVTYVFEKAFFSSREISQNEIERFNDGIKNMNRVI